VTKSIRIINRNFNTAVTDGMSKALEPLRCEGGPALHRVTLTECPFEIESEADSTHVAPLLADYMKTYDEADAFVIVCCNDLGLHLCREVTERPVFGITTTLTQSRQLGELGCPPYAPYAETPAPSPLHQ